MNNLSKRATACILIGVMLASLTGCNQRISIDGAPALSRDELSKVSLITDEELLTTQKVTGTDEQLRGMVYQYVTGNLTVDAENLLEPDDMERQMVYEKLSRVVLALRGQDNNSIDDNLLNYMLWEFARTQKEWEVDGDPVIVGVDPSSRKVFVDLTFKTTDVNKPIVIPLSRIIEGSPLEESLKSARYDEYMKYISAKYSAENGTVANNIFASGADADKKKETALAKADEMRKEFENHWGSIDQVLDEQQGITLVQRLRRGISNLESGLYLTIEPTFWDAHRDIPIDRRDPVISAADLGADTTIKITDAEGNEKTTTNASGYGIKTPLSSTDLRYVSARGIGTYTYSGITKQTYPSEATMTFRFILDFKFNLGSQTTLNVSSVYLKDYLVVGFENSLGAENDSDKDSDTASLDNIAQSTSVVKPYIDRCIDSYQKCIEENDIEGLYKLYGVSKSLDDYSGRVISTTSRFQDWDKYYLDWSKYAYTKFDAYEYEIIDWVEDRIRVKVTRNKKIRSKGSEMTMPSYTEEALLTLIVDDDNVYIDNEVVFATHLVGEPVSMIKDVSGIANKIAYSEQSFSVENEAAVVEALKAFSKLQLTYANAPSTPVSGSISDAGYIDLGVGNETLAAIKETMGEYSGPTEKITWLGTWSTRSNVYCKVRIRELFFSASGSAIDTEAYVGLVSRNGVWTVVSYDRTLSTKSSLTKDSVSDKGCLSHDYANGTPSTSDFSVNTDTSAVGTVGAQTGNNTTSSATETTQSSSEAQPVETQPVATEPVETQPVETQPVETQPVETEPVVTEPAVTESTPVEDTSNTSSGTENSGAEVVLPADVNTSSDTPAEGGIDTDIVIGG